MNNKLVNFRVPQNLINDFDRVCELEGSTRTQLLHKLIKEQVRTTASDLPLRSSSNRRISRTIRNAVLSARKRSIASDTTSVPKGRSRRLKSFSRHLREQGI